MLRDLTPAAKRLLMLSNKIADELGMRYVGTEIIFLALIRMNFGVAGHVIESAGITESSVLNVLDPTRNVFPRVSAIPGLPPMPVPN